MDNYVSSCPQIAAPNYSLSAPLQKSFAPPRPKNIWLPAPDRLRVHCALSVNSSDAVKKPIGRPGCTQTYSQSFPAGSYQPPTDISIFQRWWWRFPGTLLPYVTTSRDAKFIHDFTSLPVTGDTQLIADQSSRGHQFISGDDLS